MKKITLILSLILVLLLGSWASSSGAEGIPWDPERVLLTFEGAEIEQMTVAEFLSLEQITVHLVRTNSKGKTTTGDYTGVHWTVLSKAIGAERANSIEVVASDGFVQAYPLEVLEAEDSLFALYKDGEAISEEDESGQLWFCAGAAFTANYWSKYLVKIVIR